jgi:hypothetical protein
VWPLCAVAPAGAVDAADWDAAPLPRDMAASCAAFMVPSQLDVDTTRSLRLVNRASRAWVDAHVARVQLRGPLLQDLCAAAPRLPALRALDVAAATDGCVQQVADVLPHLRALTSIVVRADASLPRRQLEWAHTGVSGVGMAAVAERLPAFPGLQRLEFDGMRGCTGDVLRVAAAHLPELRALRLPCGWSHSTTLQQALARGAWPRLQVR